jgi:hypothetical protein
MTTKADILQAIRNKCLDCSCHQPREVRECPVSACDLWPYRFGSDPNPGKARGCAKPVLVRSDSDGTLGRLSETGREQPSPESLLGRDGSDQSEACLCRACTAVEAA